SDNSMYKRFISTRKDMPHERLQDFSVIDYRKEMYLLATDFEIEHETIFGLGQYWIDEETHTAEIAFIILDNYHRKGIGEELLTYLTLLAKKQGLLGFTAEVLVDNIPMQNLFKKAGFDITKRVNDNLYELKMLFRE
ncbi:MAG: GNAT family N-acetyltransferase, partial [Candidatus Marinimicrobia bacterium]|nr:GNAT family N-acetyltransferase [Candidatus Neomarinimicrobiota bacterium]